MPGAGAGKRRSAPGMATSNTNSIGRGGTVNETQPPASSPTISVASPAAPPAACGVTLAATPNQPAAPATASQPLSTGPPVTTSPPGVTPSSVTPSRSLHSSHSPTHHRSSTRHRLVQVRHVPAMEGRQRGPDPDSRPRSRNPSRGPVNVLQRARAPVAANGSGDQDTSATRLPRLLPKRLAELSGNKSGTGIKKMENKVIRSGWPKRMHPLPVSPLASSPVSRGKAVSIPVAYGENRTTDSSATAAPQTPPPTITFTMAPTTTASTRPLRTTSHTTHRTSARSISQGPRRSPIRSPVQISLLRTLTHPTSRNMARDTQPHSASSPTAPPKTSSNSLFKYLPLNSSKAPVNSPSKTSSISSPKTPLYTFPTATPYPPSKSTANSNSTTPNSLSRAFTRARFSHVSRTPFRESKFVNPNTNGSLSDPYNSIPSGPSSIAAACPPTDPLSSPPSNTPTNLVSGPTINSSRPPKTNVANTQTPPTTTTRVSPCPPPFRGMRAFLNERKMKHTSSHIPKSAPASGAVTDLDSLSELPTSSPIDASALSRKYGTSENSAPPTVLTPAALPLVRACFRMMQRSSGNEHLLKSSSASSKISSATDGDISEISISKTSVLSKSKDQCEKKLLETMASLNSKPKDRLEKTSQKSREIPEKGSINPLRVDSLDCKTLSQCSSNTILRPAKRKSNKEAATSTGNLFERRHSINTAVNLTKQSTSTVNSVTSKKSIASQTVSVHICSKRKLPLRVTRIKTPTKQQQKVAHVRTPLSSRTSSPRSPPRTPNPNGSLDRKYLRSKTSSRQRSFPKPSLHSSRKKVVKQKQNPVLQKQASKTSIRSKSTQTRANSREKEDTTTTNTTVPDKASEPCPLKDFDFRLSGLPVLLWPSPIDNKHSNQEGSGDVLSKTEAQLFHDRMVMVPAHRVEQALGLLQRQQRLLQSVLRTTPEGPPASRGGDHHHRREKWGAATPKGSKSPSAKRKTGSSSATDVQRTRKRSRKNKKRKTVQGVEG